MQVILFICTILAVIPVTILGIAVLEKMRIDNGPHGDSFEWF